MPPTLTQPRATLSPVERELARRLRQAARIVGHAALPSEYRDAAFARVLDLELAGDGDVQVDA